MLLATGLAALMLIFLFILIKSEPISDPNDIISISVSKKVRENISKLTNAVLVWSYERKGFGPWINEPEIKGNYKLYWNKNRTAISCDIITTTKDPNNQLSSNQEKSISIFDGKKFLWAQLPKTAADNTEVVIMKKQEYKRNDNYLSTIGWQGFGLLNVDSDASLRKHRSPGYELWTVVDSNDGRKLIKHEFHNTKTGQVGITYYDPRQGFVVVCDENYASAGHLQSSLNLRYVQVSGGAWFPVEYNMTNFNIQNGEIIAQSKTKVNLEKSVFNDPSAIPNDVFEFNLNPNDKVIDATSLKTRLKLFLNDF